MHMGIGHELLDSMRPKSLRFYVVVSRKLQVAPFSGSFSIINVASGFHCLRSFFLLLQMAPLTPKRMVWRILETNGAQDFVLFLLS
jgi:hypothetical protein